MYMSCDYTQVTFIKQCKVLKTGNVIARSVSVTCASLLWYNCRIGLLVVVLTEISTHDVTGVYIHYLLLCQMIVQLAWIIHIFYGNKKYGSKANFYIFDFTTHRKVPVKHWLEGWGLLQKKKWKEWLKKLCFHWFLLACLAFSSVCIFITWVTVPLSSKIT